jgi:hypothetical protein
MADAEAALGWLNWQANLQLRHGLSPATVADDGIVAAQRTPPQK